MAQSTRTTFTPLSRKRLRCNQTGVIIKRAKADGFRRHRSNAGRPPVVIERWRPPPKPKPKQELPKTYGTYYSDDNMTGFTCPHCWFFDQITGHPATGERECRRCKEHMNLTEIYG